MGKNEFLTPKAIANRIKAKGLQKLRWYCQMCQKQCRDENGFKCHCMSESHQRQMQVFGENPNRFVDGFSQEFEKSFLEHVKRSHRFSRVAATVLYNEYIADRHHIHMNSTQWATLTEFVKHLGKTGKCKVDETEKGWFVTYIDREPETLLKEALKNKRERSEMADEERHEREIQQQINRASKSGRFSDTGEKDENGEEEGNGDGNGDDGHSRALLEEKKLLQRSSEDEKVVFSFSTSRPKVNHEENTVTKGKIKGLVSFEDDSISTKDTSENLSLLSKSKSKELSKNSKSTIKDIPEDSTHQSQNSSVIAREDEKKLSSAKGGKDALAQLMAEEEKAKEKVNRKDYWLTEGLVVKVMSKSLMDQGLYKQKGVVRKVIGKYVGEIKMLESGMVVKVDQAELETVIPQIGGIVKIVNGAYRGSNARLLSIKTSDFTAKVQIEKGIYDGRMLNAVDYEDICKFSS